MDLRTINVLSICSGGGGLDLGIRLAIPDARVICYVENEAFACEALVSKMETGLMDQAPIWTDLRTFDGQPWRGIVDCIVGGYPCQPFSITGRKKGKHDPRHLWPCIINLIKNITPSYVFFENVANHLRIGYETVRRELQEAGYMVEQGIFSAEEVGATHLRKRLFILGYRSENVDKTKTMVDSVRRGYEKRVVGSIFGISEKEQDNSSETSKSGCVLGNTNCQGLPVLGSEQEGLRQEFKTFKRTSWNMGFFPPGPEELKKWEKVISKYPEVKPALCLLDDELAPRMVESILDNQSMQIRLLGNGVVPACAAFAFGILFERIRSASNT